jgi:hypothetical protein
MTLSVCNMRAIKGGFVASGTMTNRLSTSPSGGYSSAYVQARFLFDDAGRLKVQDGLSAEGGNTVTWTGDGRYFVDENCVGEMEIQATVAGGIDVTMRFDILVSGRGSNLEIAAISSDSRHRQSTQLLLRKSRFK